MSDKLRQIAVAVTVLGTLIVNLLANALPLNNLKTGEISDRFQVYFVPAGYVFSIWGLIYVGLIAYAVYQALPAQRTNPRLQAIGWWVILSGIANSVWIFLWHYEQFLWTPAAMLILLGSLILIYLRLGIGQTEAPPAERWAVHIPFSIYLGWITVATVANITALLDYAKWDGFGLAPEVWTAIMLAVVLFISALMILRRHDVAYTLVILWAIAGIAVKHSATPAVMWPAWITFGLTAAVLVYDRLRHKPQPVASG